MVIIRRWEIGEVGGDRRYGGVAVEIGATWCYGGDRRSGGATVEIGEGERICV
jgi:hypothetical protein